VLCGGGTTTLEMAVGHNPSKTAKNNDYCLYDKPSMIANEYVFLHFTLFRDLLLDPKSSNTRLKGDIIEHFDYEVVSQEVWYHLYSWYSADYCLFRWVQRDRFNNNTRKLELYPGKKSCH
jgi:hypothetical protein